MKKGQNGSSERSLMFGGNIPPSSSSFSQVTSIDGVKFNEGDLLLQVTP